MTMQKIGKLDEQVQDVAFDDALGKRYLSYALSTIMSRSLPDVRDGLKPVHRRLLYAMHQLKLDPKTGFKKCARIVGDVIGKYHPHGEASIYDALVRMAQLFSSRYPIIDGQGNFGSIDGDNQASMRYTEARLTDYALYILKDLEQDTTDFRPNYDGSDDEPVVMPSSLPNLLANGSEGIAVGMATSIPPHNLLELCDASLYLIKHRDCAIDALLKFIKGPDFPTGGTLIEPYENIKSAYTTGRGSFRLRSKWHKEELERGQYQIVITEIPYQITKRSLIEKLAALYHEKRLPFLESFQDMSAEDIRIILEPKNKALPAESIMETLFKITDLEIRVPLNMNVLDSKSIPQVMDLKQILNEFLDHRQNVTERKLNFRLKNIEHRLEVLNGLLIAYLNLDEVIRIIREEDDAKVIMIGKWHLTDVQAEAILNTRLRSLRKLEEISIKTEHENLAQEKNALLATLQDPSKLFGIIADELKEIKAKFIKSKLGIRRTLVESAAPAEVLNLEKLVEKEPLTIFCSELGWLKAQKSHGLELSKYKEGDKEKFKLEVQNTDKILFFTNYGKFYTLNADKISRGKGDGDPIRIALDLQPDEVLLTMIKHIEGDKLLVSSINARGFIINSADAIAQTKGGKQVLVVAPGEAQKCLKITGKYVMTLGENRRLLVFETSSIPQMRKGKGVCLQKLKQGTLKDLRLFDTPEEFAKLMRCAVKDMKIWQAARGSLGRIVLNKLRFDA